MKKIAVFILITLLFITGRTFCDTTKEGKLIEPLKFFSSVIGKTWSGKFQDPRTGKINVDVSRWERALNGTAIRILHSLNKGQYGGETIITWDSKKKRLQFHYFTTGGFMTTGWMEVDGRKYISHEKVIGNASGITDVKAVAELRDDGTMSVESSYLKKGKWVKGMTAVYREAPGAEVIFR